MYTKGIGSQDNQQTISKSLQALYDEFNIDQDSEIVIKEVY